MMKHRMMISPDDTDLQEARALSEIKGPLLGKRVQERAARAASLRVEPAGPAPATSDDRKDTVTERLDACRRGFVRDLHGPVPFPFL